LAMGCRLGLFSFGCLPEPHLHQRLTFGVKAQVGVPFRHLERRVAEEFLDE
jgi:hypothetical protein